MACDRLRRVCRCHSHNCTCTGMITLGTRNPADATKDEAESAVDVVPLTDISDAKAQNQDSPKRVSRDAGVAKVKFKQDVPKNKQRVSQQNDETKRNFKAPANQTNSERPKGGGSRVTFLENPTLHVLQPHSHKRHFPHHLLDHFSSSDMLRRNEKKNPQRQKWQELTPVSTSCEYKDSNFLSEGPSSQLIMVKQQLEPSLSMSDGEMIPSSKTHPPLKATVWRRTPVLYGDKKNQANTKHFYNFKYETVDGPYDGKFPRKRDVGRTEQSGKSRTGRHGKFVPYLDKPASKGSVAEFDGPVLLRSSGTQKNKLRRTKSLKSNSAGPGAYLYTRGVQTDLSSFDQLGIQHRASQTDPRRANVDDIFLFDKSSEISDSSVSSSSYVDSSLVTTPTEEYADDKSSCFEDLPSGDLTPNSYFRFQLQARSKHIHNKLRRMRDHLSTQHKSRIDVTNAAVTLLNELEQVVFEAYELYDDFECDVNRDADKLQELRRELQATKRTCRILEYELMRTDANAEDAERINELEEETKLCRHVAVSLHWELQAADEKLQKVEIRNTDLHERLVSAEVEKSIYEKEAMSLRNMVDQMSLHASSVPTEPEPTFGNRETIPELQRQVRFYDEERRAVLSRLVEVEKERDSIQETNDNYRRIYGEILLPLRSLESEEWRTKDLKIRIRMAEDQAGVLGRRVMQLEIDNGTLMKQVEDWESTNAEQSRKATTSDVQFLEDEVEALRLALQEVEQENLVLRDQISQMNRMAKEREKMLLLDTPKIEEKVIPLSPLLEKAMMTPTDAEQPWSLPDHKSMNVNRSDSEMTLSAMNVSDLDKFSMRVMTHVRTAIDAETQTIENMQDIAARHSHAFFCAELRVRRRPKVDWAVLKQVSEVIQRILGGHDIRKPQGISRELINVLARSKEADVEHVVEQLHNLAIATRSLLGDSEVTDICRVVSEDKATQNSEGVLVHYRAAAIEEEERPVPKVEVITVEKEPTVRYLSTFQFLVLALISYVTATSLPLPTLFKLVVLAALFFVF